MSETSYKFQETIKRLSENSLSWRRNFKPKT